MNTPLFRSPRMNSLHPRSLHLWPVVASGLLGSALPALAADDPTVNYNRFRVGARFFYNISTEIQNGAVPAAAGPVFDDGSVLTDISGNAGGRTWNWSYAADSQRDSVNGNMEFHSMTSPRDGFRESISDDPEWGFDLSYGRVLGQFGLRKRKVAWGLETGFSSTDIEQRSESSVAGNVLRQTHQFALVPGVLYPSAPYAGTFAGPGPLLGTTPTSLAPIAVPATSLQRVQIDGLFYGLRLGPFIEIPLFKRFTVAVAGGGTVVHAEADATIEDSFTLAAGSIGGPPPLRTSQGDGSDWLFGAYGEVRLSFDVTDSTSVYIGAQYQILDDFAFSAGSKTITIDLGESYAALVGLSFRF